MEHHIRRDEHAILMRSLKKGELTACCRGEPEDPCADAKDLADLE